MTPRSITAFYSVRVGQLGGSGSGAKAVDASADAEDGGTITFELSAVPLPDTIRNDALDLNFNGAACTPAARRVAEPILQALSTIRGLAEHSRMDGRYPAGLHGIPTKIDRMKLTYIAYNGDKDYVVAIDGDARALAGFVNCGHLSMASSEEIVHRNLYVSQSAQPMDFFAFSPLVGLYDAQAGPLPAKVSRTMQIPFDPEPAAAPSEPLTIRPTCPISARPIATAVASEVMILFHALHARQPLPHTEVADVSGSGSAPFWIGFSLHDVMAENVDIPQCLHVAAVSIEHLHAARIEDKRNDGIGFSERFGFYSIGGQ